MLNIIKADLYRITRGVGFYIAIAVFLGMLILQTFSANQNRMTTIGINIESIEHPEYYEEIVLPDGTTQTMYNAPEVEFTGIKAPSIIADSSDNLIYFLLPFIVFIAAADFSHGAVKNLLSGGSSRVKYYLSKLVLISATCVILMLLQIILPIIFATAMNGFGGDFNGAFIKGVLKIYLPQLYLLFAYSCIGVFIAFAFKRTAILNTVYLVYSLVPSMIILILEGFNEKFGDLIKYDLVFNLKSFAYPDGAVPPDLARALIIGGFYILGCTIGGILLFRKSEIK